MVMCRSGRPGRGCMADGTCLGAVGLLSEGRAAGLIDYSYAKGDERDRLGDRHDDKCPKGTRRMSKVYSLYGIPPVCSSLHVQKEGGYPPNEMPLVMQ